MISFLALTLPVWTLLYIMQQEVFVNSEKTYQIQLDRFEPYTNTEKEFFDPGTLRVARKGRNNFVLSGEFSLFKNFGDELTVKYTASRKSLNGKYTQMLQGANTLCAQMDGDTKYYPLVAAASNMPIPPPCPFPKGTYTFNNFEIGEEFLPQVVPPGEYMTDVVFVLEADELFGFRVYITVM